MAEVITGGPGTPVGGGGEQTLQLEYKIENGVFYERQHVGLGAASGVSGWAEIGREDASGIMQMDKKPTDIQMAYLQRSTSGGYSVAGQRFDLQGTPLTAEGVPTQEAMLKAVEKERGGILEGYRTAYEGAQQLQRGAGTREAADIREAYGREAARGRQELTTRGFAGTTVLPTMRAGATRQRVAATGRLEERLRKEKLGLHTGYQQAMLQFRERGVPTPGQVLGYSAAYGAGGFYA